MGTVAWPEAELKGQKADGGTVRVSGRIFRYINHKNIHIRQQIGLLQTVLFREHLGHSNLDLEFPHIHLLAVLFSYFLQLLIFIC